MLLFFFYQIEDNITRFIITLHGHQSTELDSIKARLYHTNKKKKTQEKKERYRGKGKRQRGKENREEAERRWKEVFGCEEKWLLSN